jgi:hypothetical protein
MFQMWEWILQHKELLFDGTAGSALIAIAGFAYKKIFERPDPPPPQAPHIVVAPTFAPLFQNTVGENAPEPEKSSSPVKPKSVETTHNISYLGVKVVNLVSQYYRSEDHLFITPKQTAFQGAALKFRNNAELNQVRSVRNARSFLRFFGKDSKEIGEGVADACWLTDEGNFPFFDLIPGGLSGTLLSLMTDGKRFIVPHRRAMNTGWGHACVTDFTNFEELPPYIEVSILDSGRRKVLPSITICLAFENGELHATTET